MVKQIPLTRGQVALVDDADYDWLNQWKWQETNGYATRKVFRNGVRTSLRMHRALVGLDVADGMQVDHINANPLDNRRSNLRLCSNGQNRQNCRGSQKTSRFKGVYYPKNERRCRASIRVNKHTIHLGTFDSETDAARAYNAAAMQHFGEFARLNEL